MSEWGSVRLGEVADIMTGFPFQSAKYTNDQDDPRLLRGDNIAQGVVRWEGAKHWPRAEADHFGEYRLRENDVVLAMDRPWIDAGLKYASIRGSDLPSLLVQRVARLRGKNGLDTRFLKYVIGTSEFTHYVRAVQTGTAVPHISAGQIGDFEFPLPPLTEQSAITSVLGSLEGKVELNYRSNLVLESIARTVFKHWFMDFEFPNAQGGAYKSSGSEMVHRELLGGDVPRYWKVSEVGKEVEIGGGATPDTSQGSFWEGGELRWATPRDMSKLQSPILFGTERMITHDGLRSIGSRVYPTGTVLLSSRAPIGYLALSKMETAVNQGIIAMVCTGILSNYYMLNWCRCNMRQIESRANGTTFKEISKSNFRSMPILVPPEQVVSEFNSIVAPLYSQIQFNIRQSEALMTVRNILLPQLISGRVRVPIGSE